MSTFRADLKKKKHQAIDFNNMQGFTGTSMFTDENVTERRLIKGGTTEREDLVFESPIDEANLEDEENKRPEDASIRRRITENEDIMDTTKGENVSNDR